MSTPITTDYLIPLSANYPYDAHIRIKSDVAQWQDGYVTYVHPAFAQNKDIALNNNTIFNLASPMNLFNMIEDRPLDSLFLGNYAVMSINNQYVTNVGNELYLSAVSGNDSFFRIIGNSDGTLSFLHAKGLYVTVSNKNPYNLTLENPQSLDENHHQKFNYEAQGNQAYIMTFVVNEADIGATTEQRYWSYTKFGPETGKLRAIGTVANEDYLFTIDSLQAYYTPTGLTRDHTWVKYFNTLNNTAQNHNVEINDSISALNINHLFDLPYNTKIVISNQKMDVNFANMKNIQNPNYEYNVKTETDNLSSLTIGNCGEES